MDISDSGQNLHMTKRFKRFRQERFKNSTGISAVLRGQEYRSQLEARWAEFFFQLGVVYVYEGKSFGGYVPDFMICMIDKRFAIRDRLVQVESVLVDDFGREISKTEYGYSPECHWGRYSLFIEIKPTVRSREECLQKFLHARGCNLITFIGNPPGIASFVENTHGMPRPQFGYCDICGIIGISPAVCRCGEVFDADHEMILRAAARAVELNFTDVSDDFKEFA